MKRRSSRFARVACAAAVLAAAIAPAVWSTSASADDDQTVTWSVRPADESGPDGRAWAELELEPGETTTERMAVINLGDSAVTFSLASADGYLTESGRFNMLPSDEKSTRAGTWITLPSTVTVEPGATAVVPFLVEVPKNATPGDHAAGVAASIRSEGASEGAAVGVESRVGFRVMVRVAGDVAPGLEVHGAGEYITEWNPLNPGTVVVRYTLHNSGNVRLESSSAVEWNGRTVSGETVELLPGDDRAVELHLRDVWPLGLLSVPLSVERAVVLPDGSREHIGPVMQTVSVSAIPWPQLLVLLSLVLMVGGMAFRGRRRRRQVETLVNAAREAGRREARIEG
ncbi:DUF916 domain-containing protein [Microbacterium sp. LWO13-1.2]|uniref:WxL protein peptidoglycan domain-containing protein n=1 Tax=Microbacterium sp. LWO13-1.2 TaxID=3135262 RepID=UPI003139EC3B